MGGQFSHAKTLVTAVHANWKEMFVEAFVNGQFAADIKPPILWKTEIKIEGLGPSINNSLRNILLFYHFFFQKC